MRTADFYYYLPPDLIAQRPALKRDESRLLVLDRKSRQLQHRTFRDFSSYLRKGDALVVNNSKVIPARLRAVKPETGGVMEMLLVEEIATNEWWTMIRPGKRARTGKCLQLKDLRGNTTQFTCEVLEKSDEGHYRVRFHASGDIKDSLAGLGEVPLPPYIQRAEGLEAADAERYQTVFAQPPGSVAAPTAGLHFTPRILQAIRSAGVEIAEVTLHVGLGTFAPVKAETLENHRMHEERYNLPEQTAEVINRVKESGGRIFAVGTTSLRVVESVATTRGENWVVASAGKTRLFVHPPSYFRIVDALLTNFHLPESTLLMLVSAFASPGGMEGRGLMLDAYREAIRQRYRFFSYGDAMLIL